MKKTKTHPPRHDLGSIKHTESPRYSTHVTRVRSEPVLAMPPRVMTVKDVSGYLRVHTSTIYRLLKRGELPAFKVGSDWRFNIESIDQWRLTQTPPEAGGGNRGAKR